MVDVKSTGNVQSKKVEEKGSQLVQKQPLVEKSCKIKGLKCRECGRLFPPKALYVCDFCYGPLEVNYDYDEIRQRVSREKIASGSLTLWRYWDFLPVETKEVVSLQEGYTPLRHARNLGSLLGLKNLYVKNDAVNPTYSFKDRVVSVAVNRSRELGFDTLACASTGNLAGSVAAYGAVSGMKTFVFIPADLESGKIVGCCIYGPNVIGIDGNYDQVNRLCAELADVYHWAFVNVNLRPYYSEGSKTLGFEVAEQLGWRTPDHCVVPAASGSLLVKIYKGFQEFIKTGIIPSASVKMSVAQANGCSPIVTALREKIDILKPVRPNTLAKSLAIGNPADGYYTLKVVRETGGFGETATDEEIIDGIKLLARTEGIFTEPAGGVTVAVLKKLAESGRIKPDETVVAFITGNGLKTQEAVTNSIKFHKIPPKLDSFRELYKSIT